LVGFGFAGRVFHAPVIRAARGVHLTTIVQRHGDPDPAYGDVEFVRSVDELLKRPVELVVVATPNPSHHPIAKQCLRADRHVVVDKPFTTTVREAEDLVKVARKRKRLLSVYQNRRYTGDFETVRQIVAQGVLGRIVSYEAHFDRFRPDPKPDAWREKVQPGSGVWFDLGPHLLDQVMLLFGIPEAIGADIRIERDGAAVDDAFDVTLYYPHLRPVLRASMLREPLAPSFALFGTSGSFIKYGLDPQEADLKAGRRPDEPDWDVEAPEWYGKLMTREISQKVPTLPSSFTHYYENVAEAIAGTAELAVPPEWALDVMRGLELAFASSRKRHVVRWPRRRWRF
jgi:predicted dehydrogenase